MKDIICDEILQCVLVHVKAKTITHCAQCTTELLHLHNSCYSHIMVLHPVRDSLSKTQMHEY